MRYINAAKILPEELLAAVQKYANGAYLYIPALDNTPKPDTRYEIELKNRNRKIWLMSLEGVSNKDLSGIFHLSESSIRRILIQKNKEEYPMEALIRTVLPCWRLSSGAVRQIYSGTWQIEDHSVIKKYSDRVSLERNITVIQALHRQGIPVGNVKPAVSGDPYVCCEGTYYACFEKLSGSNLVDLTKCPSAVYQFGSVLAKLHTAFVTVQDEIPTWQNSLLEETRGWIRDTLEKENWQWISQESFLKTLSALEEVYPMLPVQLIHRDVHFGNFLFHKGSFSGYIDFDLSQCNIRIFDICYFILGLLSEDSKLHVAQERWLSLLEQLLTGYQQSTPLTSQELKAIPCVMKAIELLFIAWNSRQNDREGASSAAKLYTFTENNEHSIRVCAERTGKLG